MKSELLVGEISPWIGALRSAAFDELDCKRKNDYHLEDRRLGKHDLPSRGYQINEFFPRTVYQEARS